MPSYTAVRAFTDPAFRQQAKMGIMLASLIAGVVGFVFLRSTPSAASVRPGDTA